MDLEPGPYPVACGWDDKASDLDQVGLSAPLPHTECLGLQSSFHPLPARRKVAVCVETRTHGVHAPQAPSLSRPAPPGAHPPVSP